MLVSVARQHQNPAGLYLRDDGRLQPGKASVLGQLAGPAIARQFCEARFRSAVAVPLVVFNQSVVECEVGSKLPLAGHRGLYPEAIRVGSAAEAAHHLGARHLRDVGGIQLGGCAVVPSGLRFGECLPIASFIQ